ncbi:hypothetical protein EB118_20635 [bacterium]|nr:hypothetical protein [bacterium]
MNLNKTLKKTYTRINQSSVPSAQLDLCASPPSFCKALWALGDWIPTNDWMSLLTELIPFVSHGVLYTPDNAFGGKLHFTLFQLQTFPVDINILPPKDEFIDLKDIVWSYPSFHVQFNGISKTRNGLFLCGYPTTDINKIRERIRSQCNDIKEPHPQDICHSTVFRFHTEPSLSIREQIDDIVARYTDIPLFKFVPKLWEYGWGTWTQTDKTRIVINSFSAAPLWICHRALKNGPNKKLENKEVEILRRLEEGWNVEIDVWNIDGVWWLGHDNPESKLIDKDILKNSNVWVHCKNLKALQECIRMGDIHCFTHNSDEAVLTSKQYIWCYPGIMLGKNSVCVMPERCITLLNNEDVMRTDGAVCSDYTPNIYSKLKNNEGL